MIADTFDRYTIAETGPLRHDIERFGFASIDGALDGELVAALRREAAEQQGVAAEAIAEGDVAVAYRARIGSLGPVARGLLQSPATAELLSAVLDKRLVMSQDASCYTFYRAGDHLGAHQDQEIACAATLILYLEAAGPDPDRPDTGLKLKVYGDSLPDDRVAIREIPTRIGRLVLGRGSEVWHERPRLLEGEHVAALTACFALEDANPQKKHLAAL